MEGVPLPPGIPGLGGSTDPLEAVLGPFPCARLRNLPYDASVDDILRLLQGLVVIDVVLIRYGEAFILFANPMDFQMALQRDGQTLGRRFVEIDPSSRSDYYDAIVNQHLQGRHVSAGTSLPDELSAADDHRSIDDAAMTAAALWGTAPIDTRGPPPYGGRYHGGTVPVEGPGAPLPNHGTEGHRGGLHAPVQKRTGGGLQVGEHTGFLRMRGLPFSAAKEDILEFFREYNPVPESIVLTYRNDGRATGEAYVGFTSAEDSRRAMELHRRMIGSRYIELFISNKDEQGRALTRFGNR